MRKRAAVIMLGVLFLGAILGSHLRGADEQPVRHYEYATIRWAGRDYTHIIRPGGRVEFIGTELKKVVLPQHADDRAFYMNVAANGLTKEGYRAVCMTSDEILMEREAR